MIHHLFSEPLSPKNSVALDLSATNSELNSSIYGNISAFCDYKTEKLGGRIGFGGYLEHRVIYESHANFAPNDYLVSSRFQGDYPGVCSQRDLAFYANNCPDPALN